MLPLEYPNFNGLTLHVVFNWALSFLKKNISKEKITFGQNEKKSHDNPRFCRFPMTEKNLMTIPGFAGLSGRYEP